MNNDIFGLMGDIFNPASNPFFTPTKDYDDIEEAIIIEEIKNNKITDSDYGNNEQ